MSPGPCVQLDAITAGYRGAPWRPFRPVLRGGTLAAEPGRVTALVGPNGAGKTTLFHVVLGYLPTGSGRVTVDGCAPSAYRVAHGVGYLPDEPPSLPGWTPGSLLAAAWSRAGSNERGAAARSLEAVGMGADARTPMGRLSRGQHRRTLLALALVGEPGLLVLDEPWSGLDPLERDRLRALLAELASSGRTVLISSHETDEVARAAHRVHVLGDGWVRALPGHPTAGDIEQALREGMVPGSDSTCFRPPDSPQPPPDPPATAHTGAGRVHWGFLSRAWVASLRTKGPRSLALALVVGFLAAFPPRMSSDTGRPDVGIAAAMAVAVLVHASGCVRRHLGQGGAVWLQGGGAPGWFYMHRLVAVVAAAGVTTAVAAAAIVLTFGPMSEPAWTLSSTAGCSGVLALAVFGFSGAGARRDATVAVLAILLVSWWASYGPALPPRWSWTAGVGGLLRPPFREVLDITDWAFRDTAPPRPVHLVRLACHLVVWTAMGWCGATWWSRRLGAFARR